MEWDKIVRANVAMKYHAVFGTVVASLEWTFTIGSVFGLVRI